MPAICGTRGDGANAAFAIRRANAQYAPLRTSRRAGASDAALTGMPA